jgi:hypothetical protein
MTLAYARGSVSRLVETATYRAATVRKRYAEPCANLAGSG